MAHHKTAGLMFIFLVFAGCWEKQDNEVLAPEAALYAVEGEVVDMASGVSLLGIRVVMKQIQLAELSLDSTIYFGIQSTLTNDRGRFRFDSVYVGRYLLTFIREGFTVRSQNFQQLYTARDEIFEIPAVFTEGILWTRDTNNLISFCRSDSHVLTMSAEDQDVVVYREINGTWSYFSGFHNPVAGSFDIECGTHQESVWVTYNAAGSQGVSRLHFLPESGWQAFPVLPGEPQGLLPVSVNVCNDSLYIADRSHLYVYKLPGLQLIEQFSLNEGMIITSMEKTNDAIWIFDKNTQYLYHTSEDLLINTIYRVFIKGESPQINDFGIDFNGRFWFTIK